MAHSLRHTARISRLSAPRRLAKNVESARQRYVPLFACPWIALNLACHSICLSKCTGTQPSCAHCASRDYVCECASEATSDSVSPTIASTTAKARLSSRRETREELAILAHHHKGLSSPSPRQLGPIIAPSSRQRYPNSYHSITAPTARVLGGLHSERWLSIAAPHLVRGVPRRSHPHLA